MGQEPRETLDSVYHSIISFYGSGENQRVIIVNNDIGHGRVVWSQEDPRLRESMAGDRHPVFPYHSNPKWRSRGLFAPGLPSPPGERGGHPHTFHRGPLTLKNEVFYRALFTVCELFTAAPAPGHEDTCSHSGTRRKDNFPGFKQEPHSPYCSPPPTKCPLNSSLHDLPASLFDRPVHPSPMNVHATCFLTERKAKKKRGENSLINKLCRNDA
jgi:hypothetical protein